MATQALTRGMSVIAAPRRFAPEVLNTFQSWLETAPDEALFRANPLDYAKAHGLSETEAVELFLYATNAGLMTFSWGMLCGMCGGFIETATAVRALEKGARCHLC